MVTDITLGAGASTDPLPVVKFLRKQGVKILVDSAYRQLTMLSGVLTPQQSCTITGSCLFQLENRKSVL